MTQVIAPLHLADLSPGFPDPAVNSQTAFRALMNTTAQPGTRAHLNQVSSPPTGINQAAAVCLLTLADQDTKLWLAPSLRTSVLENWLRFHTGAPFCLSPGEASFALINLHGQSSDGEPDLGAFHQGDAKYPDLATTVIVMVDSLDAGQPVTLRGPGIETEAQIAPTGLSSDFWHARADLVAHFQFGIDLMICAGDQLVSIPRTTRVSI